MIVFDTETTGLPLADSAPLSSQPKVIEIALVKLDEDMNLFSSGENNILRTSAARDSKKLFLTLSALKCAFVPFQCIFDALPSQNKISDVKNMRFFIIQ